MHTHKYHISLYIYITPRHLRAAVRLAGRLEPEEGVHQARPFVMFYGGVGGLYKCMCVCLWWCGYFIVV